MTTESTQSNLYKLLPPGVAWPPEHEDTVLRQFIYGLGTSLARLDTSALTNLDESFPGVVGAYLTDWERFLGLPKCPDITLTLQERASACLAMWNISPFSNIEFFVEIADVFGYEIEVRGAAINEFGGGANDVFIIVVTITNPAVPIYFRAGQSSAGDPLLGYNASPVQCLLEYFKPAHSYIEYITVWPDKPLPLGVLVDRWGIGFSLVSGTYA